MYFIIWEMHGSPHQFPKACEIAGKPIKWEEPKKLISRKILQSPSHVENLGNWYSYFSHSMGNFFPLDSHSMVYCIICELHGFPHQFPIAWENPAKSIGLGEPKKLAPIFSLTYGHFSSIRFPSYGILYHMGNAWFFPAISNSTGKCSKIHLQAWNFSAFLWISYNNFCVTSVFLTTPFVTEHLRWLLR